MDADLIRFYPRRRRGNQLHTALIAALAALSGLLVSMALKAELGLGFLLLILGALFLAVPLPVLGYRLYALNRSYYEVSRDGLRLRWGFRVEDLPVESIEWVETLENLEGELILPRVHLPGSVLGTVPHRDAGDVEFMAAEADGFVLVNTGKKVYAITPEEPRHFVETYLAQVELGSLAPFAHYSAYPTFAFIDIWRQPAARLMLTVTLVLSLALFVWVGLVVNQIPAVSLGFSPEGQPLEPVASGQLFLLPVVNLLLLAGSYALSLFFFRQTEDHPLLYVLLGNGVFTALLFLGAVYFILENS